MSPSSEAPSESKSTESRSNSNTKSINSSSKSAALKSNNSEELINYNSSSRLSGAPATVATAGKQGTKRKSLLYSLSVRWSSILAGPSLVSRELKTVDRGNRLMGLLGTTS